MNRFKLAFGIHNHQPVGNFQAVFEDAHQKAYLPLLELLDQFETIPLSLHQSGILWRWQERHHPEYFQLVGRLVDQGQIELMTGGFYEPILISIPRRDALGQIAKLSNYITNHFETSPTGLWLTERIWEPHLPDLLSASGVKYLPIDDTHFIYAGFEADDLSGPFVTENEGKKLILLPIQKKLRYLIPFGTVEEVIGELRRQAEIKPDGLAVYADDGEKFGVWPKTYEHCYGDGWLRQFFEAVEKNSDWLEVITLGEAAKLSAVGRAYIPSASYSEMLHWSLPAKAYGEYEQFEEKLKADKESEEYLRFVRGGHWRGFLTKYEESNLMHKKMLAVSEKLSAFETERPENTAVVDKARDSLYAGQCNCPYWHGVFGGLYLPHIRQAIWEALIEAESSIDELGDQNKLEITSDDYDYDGHDELIVSTKCVSAILKPNRGGTLLNLSLKKHRFDVTDTLSRRKEGYHAKLYRAQTSSSTRESQSIHDQVLAKEDGLEKLLVEDWYLKRCFIDHFLGQNVRLKQFLGGRYEEEGDFILEPYQSSIDHTSGEITMFREGRVCRAGRDYPVNIKKRFRFENDSDLINVSYELTAQTTEPLSVRFGLENNFNFQAGHAEDRFIMIDDNRHENSFLDSVGEYGETESFSMIDQYRSLAVAGSFTPSSQFWHMPIHTVSMSEGGFEKVYQGTTFLNLYDLILSEKPAVIEFQLYAGSSDTIPARMLAGKQLNPG